MVKTKIIETTEKYDKDGKLVEKITREEISDDDTIYEPGAICYQPEHTNSCCEHKCKSNVEVFSKSMKDYYKRTGYSPFFF